MAKPSRAEPLLSIVLPMLNEEASIVGCLQQLQSWRPQAEIIVVDGGSTDASVRLAEAYADTVLLAEPGRARQMNAGAKQARGRYLLFLHCDTQPRFGVADVLSLAQAQPYWGFCRVQLSGHARTLRLVEWCMNVRSRITRVATGDQLLFVQRDFFHKQGGYADIPLMEDVELCKRLRRSADPLLANLLVVTSSRRWEQHGILATILTMWQLRLRYWLGSEPAQLVKSYYG